MWILAKGRFQDSVQGCCSRAIKGALYAAVCMAAGESPCCLRSSCLQSARDGDTECVFIVHMFWRKLLSLAHAEPQQQCSLDANKTIDTTHDSTRSHGTRPLDTTAQNCNNRASIACRKPARWAALSPQGSSHSDCG
eukprot:GHUV01022230.1.p2 GENE.GHUV01022230.1~~GHUV01022230.1.p2  ORF type:complete len:137 (+),score=3.19 GHUV01022230.1:822-1232(+)